MRWGMRLELRQETARSQKIGDSVEEGAEDLGSQSVQHCRRSKKDLSSPSFCHRLFELVPFAPRSRCGIDEKLTELFTEISTARLDVNMPSSERRTKIKGWSIELKVY